MNRSPDLDARLTAAAHRLTATGGLRSVTFRAIAREAHVSVGMLGHRFGSLLGLLEHLVRLEVALCEQRLASWQHQLGPWSHNGGLPLEDILIAALDDEISNWRASAMFQAELLVTPGLESVVGLLGEAYQQFWQSFIDRSPGEGGALLPLVAGVMTDERVFSLAFGTEPAYRLLRRMGLRCLLSGFRAAEPPELVPLLRELERLSFAVAPMSVTGRAAAVSEAIADILTAQGAGAISHRTVAAQAGVPNSSVAHHFRTTEQLLEAGIAALYARIRHPAVDSQVIGLFNWIGRSTHGMALSAARDPRFRSYAIDMRWRRGENLRSRLPALLARTDDRSWLLAAQMLSIAMIGQSLLAADAGAGDGVIAETTIGAARKLLTDNGTIVPAIENP